MAALKSPFPKNAHVIGIHKSQTVIVPTRINNPVRASRDPLGVPIHFPKVIPLSVQHLKSRVPPIADHQIPIG